MKYKIHMCQSVPGALRNWKKRDWEDVARQNGWKSVQYAKDKFRIWEFEGVKVVPIGEECEGFSYQTGCPGHPQTDKNDVAGLE
jgi:hypothetical protein